MFRRLKYLFNKYPFISNSIIYGSLYVTAECSQQIVTKKILTQPPEDLDKTTLVRYGIMGTFLYSPVLYSWYKWLDSSFPGTTKQIIVKKLLLDQFLMTPNLLVIFYTGMSVMEGVDDPFAELKEKFVPTFTRSCLFWLPAQTINFYWVPPQFRIVYIGTCSLMWANILCWIKRQHTVNDDK